MLVQIENVVTRISLEGIPYTYRVIIQICLTFFLYNSWNILNMPLSVENFDIAICSPVVSKFICPNPFYKGGIIY